MLRDLSEDESRKAMREVVERATGEAKALSEEEPAASTGACCLYTFGVSSCTSGLTYNGCRKAAQNTGTMFKWTQGKSCSQVSCP